MDGKLIGIMGLLIDACTDSAGCWYRAAVEEDRTVRAEFIVYSPLAVCLLFACLISLWEVVLRCLAPSFSSAGRQDLRHLYHYSLRRKNHRWPCHAITL